VLKRSYMLCLEMSKRMSPAGHQELEPYVGVPDGVLQHR
jgi:hypothetical protein